MKTETEETKQQTIAEFIAKHGITMKAVYAGRRTEERKAGADAKSKPWEFFLWHCTLERKQAGKTLLMDQEYRMGIGNITVRPSTTAKPGTRAHADHVARWGKPTPPQADNVLDSLSLDARANEQTFEDWAGDFCYDTDSREAERIYHACIECGRKLSAFLGRELVRELQQCEPL